jgi:hypothetical protein
MRFDTIAVIAICVLALAYFVHRTRKSFRGGSSCGCGGDCGCGAPSAKSSRDAPPCPGCGGDRTTSGPPRAS